MHFNDSSQNIALALGSNIGDRRAALRAAVAGLSPFMGIKAISPLYETPAAYVTDQPAFLNMAVTGTTKLQPLVLLRTVKQLEADIGREPTFRYGPRLLDIDILFYGDEQITIPELIIPHPRVTEREFVLRPLSDIAPEWKHPQTGLTVSEMLKQIPESTARCIGELHPNAA